MGFFVRGHIKHKNYWYYDIIGEGERTGELKREKAGREEGPERTR
jgi:hypothetical protein